jgi:hypothetical protein
MNIRSRELQKINAFSMKRIILFEKIQSELQRAPVRFSSHVPSVYLKQRFPNSVVRVSAYYGAFRIVLICWQIQIARAVSYRLVSSAATELGSKMVARCSVFVQCFQATLCCCPGRATPRLSARLIANTGWSINGESAASLGQGHGAKCHQPAFAAKPAF